MVGLLLALGIQAPFVSNDSSCIKLDNTPLIISNDTTEIFLTTTQLSIIELSHWEKNKYVYIALIMTVIFLVFTSLTVFFVTEKKGIIFRYNYCQVKY